MTDLTKTKKSILLIASILSLGVFSFLFGNNVHALDNSLIEFWNFDTGVNPSVGLVKGYTVSSTAGYVYQEKFNTGYASKQHWYFHTARTVSPTHTLLSGASSCFWFRQTANNGSLRFYAGIAEQSTKRIFDVSLGRSTFNSMNIKPPTGNTYGVESSPQAGLAGTDFGWHFYCITINNHSTSVSLDGVPMFYGVYSFQENYENTTFYYYYLDSENHDVLIDDLSIWDRTLTDGEIDILYNLPNGITDYVGFNWGIYDHIEVQRPINNYIYKDFKNFVVEYKTASSTGTYLINLQYGQGTNTQEYFHIWTVPANQTQTTHYLTKPETLPNGTYNLDAILYFWDDPVANASTTTFTIDNINGISDNTSVTNTPKFKIAPRTNEQICAGIDTSSFFGSINCGFRIVLNWAFYPGADTIDNLGASVEEIKAVAPFNIYFDLTTIVSNIISTTTVADGSFGVPMIRKTSTSTEFYTIPVISSTTLSNAIGADNASLIRTSIIWVIWIFTIFIIFLIIK